MLKKFRIQIKFQKMQNIQIFDINNWPDMGVIELSRNVYREGIKISEFI